jgi:hypothetical protein
MSKVPALAIVCAGLSLFSPPAWAVPAPMSPEQLMAESDIVALVRVSAVSCTRLSRDGSTGEDLPSYSAQLEILKVDKGPAQARQTVIVTWHEIPTGVLGPWVVRYYPGEEVWTHLQWDERSSTYASTWWNAKSEQVRAPDRTDLPMVAGETFTAKSRP